MALSQEKKGTIAVSLTNFLDSGCIVASGVALAAWAIAFNFDNVWVSILGAVGANAFGAAVGALIGGSIASFFGVANTNGIDWIRWGLSLIAAIGAISVYLKLSGRK